MWILFGRIVFQLNSAIVQFKYGKGVFEIHFLLKFFVKGFVFGDYVFFFTFNDIQECHEVFFDETSELIDDVFLIDDNIIADLHLFIRLDGVLSQIVILLN